MVFVNRYAELQALQESVSSPGASLIRLYGRRRLGKTELLRKLIDENGGIYLLVDDAERPQILDSLGRQFARETGGLALPFRDWDAFYGELARLQHGIVAIDEFQRLYERTPEAVTRLQDWWDRHLKNTELKLILCGSSVGMMQRLTSGRSGALFGRLHVDFRLRAFGYAGVRLLYPGLTEADRVYRFAVFGGTPHYHRFSVGQSLKDAIHSSFLKPGAPLLDEPQSALQLEVKTPTRYNSILYEIGTGTHILGEIAGRAEVRSSSDLGPYMQTLGQDLDLIEMGNPVLGKRRRARYILTDPFFGFYYRFIFGSRPLIELGRIQKVWKEIQTGMDGYTGRVFEAIVREALVHLNGKSWRGHSIDFDEIGAWWSRSGDEIDVVAAGSKAVLAGEVSWSRRSPSPKEIEHLKAKVEKIERLGSRDVRLFFVSRGPFSPKMRAAMEADNMMGWTLRDIGQIFD